MIEISLIFPSLNINTSVKVGDTVYYSNPNQLGGFDVDSGIIVLGTINNITTAASTTTIVCTVDENIQMPTINVSFIFFSKDNKVNSSTLLGYYGLAEFRNNSTVKAELFSTGVEVVESSK
jgi:energy-converting hydrogenase Eha subunit E